jgi:hypothetical protein
VGGGEFKNIARSRRCTPDDRLRDASQQIKPSRWKLH